MDSSPVQWWQLMPARAFRTCIQPAFPPLPVVATLVVPVPLPTPKVRKE